MAVTTYGVTTAEVAADLGVTIDASSVPNETATDSFITKRAAQLGSAIRGSGLTPADITASANNDLYESLRGQLTTRVKADWLLDNTRELSDNIAQMITEWDDFVESLRTHPGFVTAGDEPGNSVKQSFDDGTVRSTWVKGEMFR